MAYRDLADYTEWYEGSFVGHNGKNYTFSIYSTLSVSDGAGVGNQQIAEVLADGIEITWEGGDAEDPMYPIIASSLDLAFLADHNHILYNIREFSALEAEDTFINVECVETGFTWGGHLLAEEVSYEITDGRTEVHLAFTDGLGLLKNYDFKYETGDFHARSGEENDYPYKAGRTVLGTLQQILYKIPWYRFRYDNLGSTETVLKETPLLQHKRLDTDGLVSTAEQEALLPTIAIHPNAFDREKKERRKESRVFRYGYSNCYDVLGDIMQTLGSKICWNGFEWHIYSPLAVGEGNSTSYEYNPADFTSSPLGRCTPSASSATSTFNLDNKYVFEAGSSISFFPTEKRFVAVHENGGGGSLMSHIGRGDYENQDFDYRPVIGIVSNNDGASYRRIPQAITGPTAFDEGKWSQADPHFQIEANTEITMRFKARLRYDWSKLKTPSGYLFTKGLDQSILNIPLLGFRMEVGTTSHSGDPYILNGKVQKVTGPADYRVRAFDGTTYGNVYQNFYGIDYSELTSTGAGEITWENVSTHPGTSSLGDGIVYFPLHGRNQNIYSDQTPFIWADQSGSDVEVTGTSWMEVESDAGQGTDDVTGYDYDGFVPRQEDFEVVVEFEVTFPELPVSVQGYDIQFGIAGMDGSTAANTTFVDTLFWTDFATDGYYPWTRILPDHDTDNANTLCINEFYVEEMAVYTDDDENADKRWFVNYNANEEHEIISTRVASLLTGSASSKGINLHNTWAEEPTASAGTWSHSYDWYTYDGNFFADTAWNGNLSVILGEFKSRFENGMYQLDLELAPSFSNSHDIFTPDMPLATTCATGNADEIFADSISWSVTSGASLTGLIYNSTRIPFDLDSAIGQETKGPLGSGGSSNGGDFTKPNVTQTIGFAGALNDALGGGDATGDTIKFDAAQGVWITADAADTTTKWDDTTTEVETARGGEASLAAKLGTKITNPGYTSGSKSLVRTGTNTYEWKSITAAELDLANVGISDLTDVDGTAPQDEEILQYDSISGTWIPTALSTALNFEDLAGTPAGGNVIMEYNGTSWVQSSFASAFQSATINLNDLDNVNVPTPTSGHVLTYNGSDWVGIASSTATFAGLTDTDVSGIADGDILQYNSTTAKWETKTKDEYFNDSQSGNYKALGTGIHLEDLANCEYLNGAGDGEVIRWNANLYATGQGGWETTSASGATALNGLSDVSITAPSLRHVLMYNGGTWYNVNPSSIAADIDLGNLGDVDLITETPVSGDLLRFNGTDWVVTNTESDVSLGDIQANYTDGSYVKITGADGTLGTSANIYVSSAVNSARSYFVGTNVTHNSDPGTTGTTSFNRSDSLGDSRSFLRIENTDNSVNLCNRTANGPVCIKANNGTAGAAGESKVVEILYNQFRLFDEYNLPTTDGTAGQVLQTNGADTVSWADVVDGLDDLSDVTITTAATGDVLYRVGSAWNNVSLATQVNALIAASSIGDLSDVDLTGVTTNSFLRYDAGTFEVANFDSAVDARIAAADTTYTFSQSGCYEITSTTDGYYHFPLQKTSHLWTSSAPTFATTAAGAWKATGHTQPASVTSFSVVGNIGCCTTGAYGKTEDTTFRGESGVVYLYKLTHAGSTGTWTSLGSTTFTIDATSALETESYSISTTGTVAAGDTIVVVVKFDSLAHAGTGYVHHDYVLTTAG